MQNMRRSQQSPSSGDKSRLVHMVGVSAITPRSGRAGTERTDCGAVSVMEESQVSGSLISLLFGVAACESSRRTSRQQGPSRQEGENEGWHVDHNTEYRPVNTMTTL